MAYDLKTLVFEFLQFRRAPTTATKEFKGLKHDSYLCPKVQRKLDQIKEAFNKYHKITYDIQGVRDQGTDVLIRETLGDQGNNFICFQIKSEDDFRDRNLLKNLKSQWFDTETRYQNLLDYYIVLCCDAEKNKKKIRIVEAEFSTKTKVSIIDPEYALSFLRLGEVQIAATLKSKLGSDDFVYQRCLEIIAPLSATERGALFSLIWMSLFQDQQEVSTSEIMASPLVNNLYRTIEETCTVYKEEKLAHDLDYLEDNLIEQDIAGMYRVKTEKIRPLEIIMLDGNVRYGFEGDELLSYMMDTFGPIEGYESEQEDIEEI